MNAVHAKLAAITAIRQVDGAGNVTNVLNYIPDDIHTSPLLYMQDTEQRTPGPLAKTYTIKCRLAVIRQVGQGAQTIFNGLITSVTEAIKLTDTTVLGGVVTTGAAWVSKATTGTIE